MNRTYKDTVKTFNGQFGFLKSELGDTYFHKSGIVGKISIDKGLITIDSDFKILFSSKLKRYLKEYFYKNEFERFENLRITLPIKFLPNEEFLQYHHDVIFQK